MKLSVIVPVFNEEQYLEKTLISLSNQTLNPNEFEIVCVVDERSMDHSDKICREHADRTITVPPGKLSARDAGIQSARGEVIVAVDSDSMYEPDHLANIKKIFENPKYVAACGWTKLLDPTFGLGIKLWYSSRLSGRNSAVTKTVYFQAGGFNLNIDQNDVGAMVKEEEVDFLRRMRSYGRIGWIPSGCIHLREAGDKRLGTVAGLDDSVVDEE